VLALLPLVVLLVEAVGYLLDRTSYLGMSSAASLVQAVLPRHAHAIGDADPFAFIESLLTAVVGYRSELSWLAVPAFLWFASRLFAGIRTSLSHVYEARQPQRHHRLVLDFLLGYLFGKLRDFGMMGILLSLALVNTALTTAVAVMVGQGRVAGAPLGFLGSGVGRLLAELVALGSAFLLFGLLYRYASPRRISWRGAAIAATMATAGFDIARRFFGRYLSYWAEQGLYSIDGNVGAALLFLLWVYWVGIVFLLGAAAADVWEQGRKQP
jgi:YihY family inner membrane protein